MVGFMNAIDGRRTSAGSKSALLAASLGFAVVQLDVSVVNVAIKTIQAQLGGTIAGLQWVVNAYTIAFAALILSAGALGDRIGAKRVFTAGFVVFTAASAACALSPALAVLIGARAVQGIGAAVLVPCSLSLLSHAYPDTRQRARAVGLWAAGGSVALSAGPLVGGLLIAWLGWRWIFLINIPIGVAAICLTVRFAVETTQSRHRRIDVAGQALAIIALGALVAATVEAGRNGFTAPLVVVGFVVAVVALAVFVLTEAHTAEPMLPLKLFRSRTVSATTSIGLILNIAFYGLIFVLSLYFQTIRHYSSLQTGLAFAPASAAVLVANLSAGRLVHLVGTRFVLAGGGVLMAASLLGLLSINAHTGYGQIVFQLVALGFGIGVIVPAMTAALLGCVDASRSGIASGALNTARQCGSALGVALLGSLAAGDLVGGLHVSLIISAVLAVTVALLAGCVE